MLKAVIDTNVLISGILSPKAAPSELLAAWRRGAFTLVTSAEIIDEVVGMLGREYFRAHYHITDQQITAVARALETQASVVQPPAHLHAVLADPDDDAILECALAGGTDYVVSGDRHLLSLGRYGEVVMVTARQFLGVIAASRPG